jgi:transcriptional regulator with XRE-family HTH domain
MADESFRTRLGAAIRRRRKERELTQVQLAAQMHIDQANITRLERGRQGFDSETIFNVAAALGCTLTDIFAEVEHVALTSEQKNILNHDESLRAIVDSWTTIRPAGRVLIADTWRLAMEHFGRADGQPTRGPGLKGIPHAQPGNASERQQAHGSPRHRRRR